MVDTQVVLNGQTIAYTAYTLAIISLMVWFSVIVTKKGKSLKISTGLFYTWVGFLVVLGVSLHIATAHTIPWKPMDIHRAEITPDKVFDISVEKHKFHLPAETLYIDLNDKVLFKVTSNDLTYGFGVFRSNNSMLFQMQVVPGHMNDVMWQFVKPGVYTIRSTEYSGPAGYQMILKDVVVVK
jgi:cytochrome c oxidase subunit 2